MPVFTDQTGRTMSIDTVPQRLISLVPSQTELLFDLGLDKEIVGITKFCVHPDEWFRKKIKVGGTKKLNLDIIHRLRPDLIIAGKEENVKEQIEELEKHYPVWISNVGNLEDAYEMIKQIGLIINKEQPANKMILRIKENFAQLIPLNSKPKTCYLIWQKPFMAAGRDTFIHAMMTAAGFENFFADKNRYPEFTLEELMAANPIAAGCQLILLSSEPFPFREKHAEEIRALGIKAQVLLVDGEMFSWYGSRLLQAPAYFRQLHDQVK